MASIKFPAHWTVDWLKAQYEQKTLTPKQVVEEILQRAERDRSMNIWITPPSMERIRPYLERLDPADAAELPLWGIPFAIKDNIDLSGTETTAACPDYAYTPSSHAPVVERLIQAGAVPVGKTNLDQFATGLVGIRSPYGETHNALKPELISGGSSSGSAVAVARGQAAFVLGTDTAGSGRVPAALNRLVGWKPSLGAWPTAGVVPACASLDCVTVFAHNLNDALLVDNAVRGECAADPWSRSIPRRDSGVFPAAFIVPREEPVWFGPYADAYRRAWRAALDRVKRTAGASRVIEADTNFLKDAAAILYEGPWVAERWAGLGAFVESHPGAALPVTETILRSGTEDGKDAASLFRAMHRLQHDKLQMRKLLQDAVLVMPTTGGTWSREQAAQDPIGANRELGRYTNHCNLLDLCAVAIPAQDAAPEVPFGITLFALADSEHLAASAARAFLESPCRPTTPIAVCGLHMRGFPLEKQMLASGAQFIREAVSAPRYRLVALPNEPRKPGMIKLPDGEGGASIALELWEMPLDALGTFTAGIPAPLGIGKVELEDGVEVPGFVCEAYASAGSEDITAYGGWRSWIAR